jgi:hypothetical protein
MCKAHPDGFEDANEFDDEQLTALGYAARAAVDTEPPF